MRKIIISIIVLILFFTLLLLIRVRTNIYCTRDYLLDSNTDIQINIDGKMIFHDSLIRFPFVLIEKKLRYGSHEISVYSKKANIIQTKNLFLLPYQYIFIEFLSGDTAHLYKYANCDSIEKIKKDNLSNNTVNNEKKKPSFIIENRFKPFYIE